MSWEATHSWWVSLQGCQVVLQGDATAIIQHGFHTSQVSLHQLLLLTRCFFLQRFHHGLEVLEQRKLSVWNALCHQQLLRLLRTNKDCQTPYPTHLQWGEKGMEKCWCRFHLCKFSNDNLSSKLPPQAISKVWRVKRTFHIKTMLRLGDTACAEELTQY